ncbi:RNA-binding protein [Bacillus timonensis]|nr:RNA-binding protein [Bacillus timonensis]
MNIYQHFRKEEHAFIDLIISWKESVESQYSTKLTDFLDPREQELVRVVVGNNSDVKVSFFGGNETTERKRALLYPYFFQPEQDDFGVVLYQITYPSKFTTIEHRQVLGALMSIGLKRGKYGDILIKDDVIQLVAAKEVSDYIGLNFESIGKVNISLKEMEISECLTIENEWIDKHITVSSTRLDVILASIHNISRQKVQTMINANLVKVNWKMIENASFDCKEGDVLSLRGYGRCKLLTFEGVTKKEKIKILVGLQK